MNKFHLIIVFIMSSTFFVEGCDTSENPGVHFYDQVHQPVEACIESEEAFQSQIDVFFNFSDSKDSGRMKNYKEELAKLRTTLDSLTVVATKSKHDLETIAIFDGGESLHRSALSIVDAYLSLCASELPQLVKLMELPPKEEDDDWYKKMDHFLYLLNSKVSERMEIFELEAHEFAKLNDIELYEEEIDEEED